MFLIDDVIRKILKEWRRAAFGEYDANDFFGCGYRRGVFTVYSNNAKCVRGKSGGLLVEYGGKLKDVCANIEEVYVKQI